jgi:hypothetical protein
MKKLFLIALFAVPGLAAGDCYCTCINGKNQPVCESAIDLKPICGPKVCPIEPPSIEPINPPTVPGLQLEQVRLETGLSISPALPPD